MSLRIGLSSLVEKNKLVKKIILHLCNFFFGFIRKFKKVNSNSDGVLVISLHLLGDSVYTIPTLKHIIRDFPNMKITILTFPVGGYVYNYFFSQLKVVTISRQDFYFNRIAKNSVRKTIKEIAPKLIIDITGAITSATAIFYANSEIVGINIPYFKNIYSIYTPLSSKVHLMKMYIEAIEPILINEIDEELFEFNEDHQSTQKILIFPFAGWKAKEWDLHNFIDLASLLSKNYSVKFIFESHQLTEEIKFLLKSKNLEFVISTSLEILFKITSECDLFISNDSGPLHIAQALGKKVFIIYGPTNPTFSIPFGNNFEYINVRTDCSPRNEQYCSKMGGKTCNSLECMKLLTVDAVYTKLNLFITKKNNKYTNAK